MTTKINGTNTAANPAITGADTDTGLSFGTDTVNINTGGTTRATVDSSGRVLIGTTTGDPYGNRQLTVASSGTTTALELRSPTNGTGRIYFTDSTASGTGAYVASVQYDHTNNFMKFETNGNNERMRIDSSGNVGISTTSPVAQTLVGGTAITPVLDLKGTAENNTSGVLQFTRKDNATQGSCIYSSGDDAGLTFRNTDGNGFGFYNGTTRAIRINPSSNIYIHSENSSGSNGRIYTNGTVGGNHTTLEINQNTGNGTEIITFRNNGTQIGQITQSGSGIAYGGSSDYRLKENDVVISDGITRVKQLRPIRFNFKTDTNTTLDGFFAHEVQSIVPESVKGEKDAVFTAEESGVGNDVEGGIKGQSLDQAKLVPLLTAALQEAIAKIEVLETKVAALEAA